MAYLAAALADSLLPSGAQMPIFVIVLLAIFGSALIKLVVMLAGIYLILVLTGVHR